MDVFETSYDTFFFFNVMDISKLATRVEPHTLRETGSCSNQRVNFTSVCSNSKTQPVADLGKEDIPLDIKQSKMKMKPERETTVKDDKVGELMKNVRFSWEKGCTEMGNKILESEYHHIPLKLQHSDYFR